jgi:hypothetical protein
MPNWLGYLLAIPSFLVNLFTLSDMIKSGRPTTRKLIVVWWMSLAGVLFAGYGIYNTHRLEKSLADTRAELTDERSIVAWGLNTATVNTAELNDYGKDYHAMLVFRLEVNSVDYLIDRMIVKSYLFEIDGSQRQVEVSLDELFRSHQTPSTGHVHVYLVVLPKSVADDRISCLADVKANQGFIKSHRSSRAALLLKLKMGEPKSG